MSKSLVHRIYLIDLLDADKIDIGCTWVIPDSKYGSMGHAWVYPCDSGSGTASTTWGPTQLDAVNSTLLSDDTGLKHFNAQE